jgi:hypothetical protein
MSNRLEQFIEDHREEFDAEHPAPRVWDNIREKFELQADDRHPAPRMRFLRLSAAAALVLVAAAGIWFFAGSARTGRVQPGAAEITVPSTAQNKTKEALQASDTGAVKPSGEPLAHASTPQTEAGSSSPEDENLFSQELFHYAKLVEIKHRELKKIQREEPLLYRQFAGDVFRLDSVYRSLENQLSNSPNREQLLEAMVQNLQLQMGLLNHQLEIIKQINHSKKSAYEKAYKSI